MGHEQEKRDKRERRDVRNERESEGGEYLKHHLTILPLCLKLTASESKGMREIL